MNEQANYQVLLVPGMKVAVASCTLREAAAWITAYNAIHNGEGRRAVIANRTKNRSAA